MTDPVNAEDDLVETVARAICQASGSAWRSGTHEAMTGPDFTMEPHDLDRCNNHWRHAARAALEAVRSTRDGEIETMVTAAYKRGWADSVETVRDDFPTVEAPHKDAMNEGCGDYMNQFRQALNQGTDQ